jgi:hypothetical protein
VTMSTQPIVERLKASRRDAELARRILLAMRYLFPSSNPKRKRHHLSGQEFRDDALLLHEIVADAETADPTISGQPLIVEGEVAAADDELPPELLAPEPGEHHRHRRGRRGRDERREEHAARSEQLRPREPSGEPWTPPPRPAAPGGRTPIPDLNRLPARAADRPAFLGTGIFGRWGTSAD